jgi:hypothetical protein
LGKGSSDAIAGPESSRRVGGENAVWALINLAAGYLLFQAGNAFEGGEAEHLVLFAGIVAISVPMSIRFQEKHKEPNA